MGLVKEIEKEFKEQDRTPEAIEDVLLRDSVLDHGENLKFEVEDVTPGKIRKKAEVELGSGYEGKPISRKRFSANELKGESDFKRTLRLLLDDDEDEPGYSDGMPDDEGDGRDGSRKDGDDSDEEELPASEEKNLKSTEFGDIEEDSEELEEEDISIEDLEEEEAKDDDGNESERDSEDESDIDDIESEDFEDMGLADASSLFEKNEKQKDEIEIFSAKAKDTDSDVAKGNAIKNQLNLWENLLECRIKLQPCLIATNKLYQKEDFAAFKSELSKVDEGVVTKTYSCLSELMKKLLELQETLLKASPEYQKSKDGQKEKEYKEDNGNDDDSDDDDDDDDGGDDESIASSEASGVNDNKENSEDVDVSEEENKLKDEPKLKKRKLNSSNNLLDEIYMDFKSFADSSIQKWYDKTRVATGKISSSDFSAFDQSTLKQIDQVLYDRGRLVKKTQLKRSDYKILGKKCHEPVLEEQENDVEVVQIKERVQNEYNAEIFDDDDFYHKLLRDFIERKSTDVGDPLKHGRQWLELQKMRSKMKRKVDMKATKGRKLRYTVHNKLVNFMAPIPCNQWTPEAETKLFSSLFGKAVVR